MPLKKSETDRLFVYSCFSLLYKQCIKLCTGTPSPSWIFREHDNWLTGHSLSWEIYKPVSETSRWLCTRDAALYSYESVQRYKEWIKLHHSYINYGTSQETFSKLFVCSPFTCKKPTDEMLFPCKKYKKTELNLKSYLKWQNSSWYHIFCTLVFFGTWTQILYTSVQLPFSN